MLVSYIYGWKIPINVNSLKVFHLVLNLKSALTAEYLSLQVCAVCASSSVTDSYITSTKSIKTLNLQHSMEFSSNAMAADFPAKSFWIQNIMCD